MKWVGVGVLGVAGLLVFGRRPGSDSQHRLRLHRFACAYWSGSVCEWLSVRSWWIPRVLAGSHHRWSRETAERLGLCLGECWGLSQ
jgi:hypothetical protein